jgi:hypothetical protein
MTETYFTAIEIRRPASADVGVRTNLSVGEQGEVIDEIQLQAT